MKRIIDYFLLKWVASPIRQPLILNGARQVGKTYAVQNLGKEFGSFVEINFEKAPHITRIFERDLDPVRIIKELSSELQKEIIPGETLLFFDEVQVAPKVIIALRYFYEEMPELHVIAAGSLLEFATQQVGVPVGRVEFMHMYPMSFIEFLAALGNQMMVEEILNHEPSKELYESIHDKGLRHVAEYLALGGMPSVVDCWVSSPLQANMCEQKLNRILQSYRADFGTYATEKQIPYVELLFKEVPHQLGGKFKYSQIEGEYRKRELQPALNLLETADIIHKVHRCSAQGFPIGAGVDLSDYKAIFLDVGLAQTLLDLKLSSWFLYPEQEFVNKGAIIESFVGQELLAYANPARTAELYYWHRQAPSSTAEIDYVIQQSDKIIPIEVKGGPGSTLRSMHSFLNSHPQSHYGIRFSTQNYSIYEKIISYPLYAVAKVALEGQPEMRKAIEAL